MKTQLYSGKDFIHRTREWTVRNMVATYISVCEEFRKTYDQCENPEDFPHKKLSELADMLFSLKENSKLIYKPFVKSSNRRKQTDHRFTPDKAEVDFLVIIGLLYHKMVISRELKYLYVHYDAFSRNYTDTKAELLHNIQNIMLYLEKSMPSLLDYIKYNAANVTLLVFLIDISTKMKKCFGVRGSELLQSVLNDDRLEEKYLLAGKYYFESGRYTESEKLTRKVLRKQPANKDALAMLAQLAMRN